jgi:hypothetical protein
MKERIIKTYESFNLKDLDYLRGLDLGRFGGRDRIDKSKIIPNSDGTYDYDDDLRFHYMNLNSLTEIPIIFRNVNGNFICDSNNLINLKGAPSFVGGDFTCSYNKLTSLEGSPSKVGGHFWCTNNQLISLQYIPSVIGGHFNCAFNNLISLQYAPSTVGGFFVCHTNNLLSKVCLSVIGFEFETDQNPFKITYKGIETVKQMTLEQQIAELKFFDEHDKNASKMLLKVLDGLGVDYGTHRKEMFNRVKDNKDLNTFF